ncbi:hypothetical protein K458DRAFT_382045 [Lentithecium fluviatile CBS 122367]|uniref:BTB domain-containing protein n=1 Tax=Lentithecium fluviatile CBS 122367 TaxID=1168545 RepID=A0A6G1JP01_9PLEO|nr:hypothetical protein K458DRAFT_382045 [Lentithecium fluviatile CBS 122367]
MVPSVSKLVHASSRLLPNMAIWNCQIRSGRNATFVTIVVSDEKAPFVIHENLLTSYSEFFRRALTGRTKEASERKIKVEGDALTFEFFYH